MRIVTLITILILIPIVSFAESALDKANNLSVMGLKQLEAGRYAEAESLLKQSLEIGEQTLGTEHPDTETSLNNLAGLYKTTGRYAEAEPLYKRALSITEKVHGYEHPYAAMSLSNLAGLYNASGRYAEAEPLLKRALSIYEKALGSEHPLTATGLHSLAYLYQATSRNAEAELFYKRVLSINEKALGLEHPYTATTLYSLAALYKTTGRYAEAEPLLQRALSITEKALGAEHPDTTAILNNLADLYNTTGRYAEAEPLLKRTLSITEKTLGPEHPDTSKSLNNLASLYNTTSRYAEAEPLLKRALSIREKALGAEHPVTATSLNNLAFLYYTTGRYAEAEPLYKRALSIREKALGSEHPDTASSLNNLAALYKTAGRYAEAEPLYKTALSIREKALVSEHPDTAMSLNNLAALYDSTGRYAEAEPLLKRALTITEKALGAEHPDNATSLINLAGLYKTTGRYAEAEPLLKRALSITEKALGAEHPDNALSLNNLAGLYNTAGRYAEAEPLLQRALSITEKALGTEHPNNSTILNNLAGLYDTTGRYAEAEPLLKRAILIAARSGEPLKYKTVLAGYSEYLNKLDAPTAAIFFAKQEVNILQGLRENVSRISKNTLKSFDNSIENNYLNLAKLLIEQGRLAEAQQVMAMLKEDEYFEFIRRDAAVINKLSTRASYIASEEPWIREYEIISATNVKLGKELSELRNKAKYFQLNDEEKIRFEKLSKEDEQTTAAFNDYLSRLLKVMKNESKANADRIEDIGAKQLKSLTTLKSMLKDLGDGSVLLHYLITDEKVYILLTTPDSQLARHSIIKSNELNKKIFSLRNALANPRIDPLPEAKELYAILLAPVAKELEASKAKTLMLSLNGPLRYLPFAALHDGSEYVAEKYRTVMYAEAARDKVALQAKPDWKVAAFGVSDKVHAEFPPLPNVPAELNAIVRNDTGGIIPGEIRLNRNFTENAMTELSARNPVVHIASHFRFVPGTDRDSFLLLGDGSTLGLDRLRNSTFFQESELLTLSACETAMGSTGKGIEIEGFGAIAMNQGAKSVIATLWSISDKSTALLMKEFYRLKEEKKLPKVEALRQAQLMLLKGPLSKSADETYSEERGSDKKRFVKNRSVPYSHPYYWAPFIMMGNWK